MLGTRAFPKAVSGRDRPSAARAIGAPSSRLASSATSRNLWFDPTPVAHGSDLPAYYDPQDPPETAMNFPEDSG